MAYKTEKVVIPEKVVLKDGRQGYFITAPVATGAVVVIKYPASKPTRTRSVSKANSLKKARLLNTD